MRLFLGGDFQYQLVMEKKDNSSTIGENNENIEEYIFYTRESKKILKPYKIMGEIIEWKSFKCAEIEIFLSIKIYL